MNARPLVTRIITRLNIGGPARQALLLTKDLRDLGFSTELLTGETASSEGLLSDPSVAPCTITGLRRAISLRADAGALIALRRHISSKRPSIVHTHMAKAGILGRSAALSNDVPVVIHTFHGHVLDQYFSPAATLFFTMLERRLAMKTDALIAVSPEVRDFLLDRGIGSPSKWHVIPLGLDLDDLLREPLDPGTARANLGLPSQGRLVAIVGRLVPIKDHQTFIAAAMELARTHADVGFVVAGDGELRARLESEARAVLGDRVRFLGWVEDLRTLYSAVDLVALSSLNEGTPVSLIEAGAARKAVVSTRVGGVAHVVQDGVTGKLVPSSSPGALAAAMAAILDHPDTAEAMGAAARNRVAERFSATRLVSDIRSLYMDLLGAKLLRHR